MHVLCNPRAEARLQHRVVCFIQTDFLFLQDEAVAIPERHLGLHMPKDSTVPDDYIDRLAVLVETHIDLEGVLQVARGATIPAGQNDLVSVPRTPPGPRVRIGVARDAAFCFYYHE